jgi:hypothetical protein
MPMKRWSPFVLGGAGTLIFDPKNFAAASTQTRAAFVYGGGAYINLTDHFLRTRRISRICIQLGGSTASLVLKSAMEAFISKSKRFAAALKRIDDGEFGICLECEEPISPKRLAGLPWAGYCLHCQELRDSEEATDTGRAENGRLRPPGRASRQNDPNRPPHPQSALPPGKPHRRRTSASASARQSVLGDGLSGFRSPCQ